MKKVSREELILILKDNDNRSYKELSKVTGYHPKSLIRINKLIKESKYKNIKRNYVPVNKLSEETIKKIIDLYSIANYKKLKMFYNEKIKNKYKISYSKICELLRDNTFKDNREILFILKKDKYLMAVDNLRECIIYEKEFYKFNQRAIEDFIKKIFLLYGVPKNICFVYFLTIPNYIKDLSKKFNFEIIDYSYKYNVVIKSKNYNNDLSYIKIPKELLYNSTIRKLISDNIIQFKNKRYRIISNDVISHLEKVKLYYDNEYNDLFINYKGNVYGLELLSVHKPFSGNSKY